MAESTQERTPRERETLIYEKPEQAEAFAERVGERVQRENLPGVVRRREAVGQELAAEFDVLDEPAALTAPWEHTKEEHSEAQNLVNAAFDQDLSVALRQARASKNYPRIIDLFHDVLTGEMYKMLQERGINRQKLATWPVWVGIGVVALFLLIVLLLLVI